MIQDLYYKITKQRFTPIHNITYNGKIIHYDREYKSHCILYGKNGSSSVAYLNKEQEETIEKMLKLDKSNGNGIVTKDKILMKYPFLEWWIR